MSRANKLCHIAHLDVREVCNFHGSTQTFDKVPIRKILIANIDPTTPHKLLLRTFEKYGKITDCILKKQAQFKKQETNPIEELDVVQNEEPNQEQNQLEVKNDENVVKSYAFITYSTPEEARRAIEAGHNRRISIKKQYLRVIPANSWNQPDNPDSRNKFCYVCKHENSGIDLNSTLPECSYYRVEDGALINRLNNDCLRNIFNFLPFIDRVRVERVSRRWKAVSEEAWHDQHKLDFDPKNWGWKSTKQSKIKTIDACSVYKILKKCCPFITHIDLSRYSSKLGNSILIELADMCSLVQYLNLDKFEFKHTGIRALAANCLQLKSITLGYTKSEYKFDKELSLLFSKNRNLEKVELDCFIIEGVCLYHLPKEHMQELIWRNANYILRSGMYKVIKKMQNLKVLKIVGIASALACFHDFIKCISSCLALEVLEIPMKSHSHNDHLNWQILKPLTDLSNLTKINLRGHWAIDDNFLILLTEKCQNLASVDISDCPLIRDSGLDSITSLPKLEYLCIDRLTDVTDNVFSKPMPNIKTLLCSSCERFQSFGFSVMIQAANELKILDLTNCQFIGNDLIIKAIRKCRHTTQRCLKMYLKGTNARIHGVNLWLHWEYLQLFMEERPKEEFEDEFINHY